MEVKMKPVLVIMAAGLGSRYGGLKQIDRIGPNGEIILELSVYDAVKAGFEKVVFIIRKDIEDDFKELIGDKLSKVVKVEYVFQEGTNIPEGFTVPDGRTKPWGTGQAILCAKNVVNEPFVVINADDYYGSESFSLMYDFLSSNDDPYRYSMVGYKLCNTLSEHGHVARGVCAVENNYLTEVIERTKIIKKGEKAFYSEDDEIWTELDYNSIVSMNMWGFTPTIFERIEKGFKKFLSNEVPKNPLKSEYYIPTIVSEAINDNVAKVRVMKSHDKWYGVTYKEDKQLVRDAIQKLIEQGVYPKDLWKDIKKNG